MSTGRNLRGTTRIHSIARVHSGDKNPVPCNVGETPCATFFTHDAQGLLSPSSHHRDHSTRGSLLAEFKVTSSHQSFCLYTSNIISPEICLVKRGNREKRGNLRTGAVFLRIFSLFFVKTAQFRLTYGVHDDIINYCGILCKH